MYDYRRGFDAVQVSDEVEIPQTFPYGLLHPGDYPEGREVSRFARIRKIPRDSQLEDTLPVRGRSFSLSPDAASSERSLWISGSAAGD